MRLNVFSTIIGTSVLATLALGCDVEPRQDPNDEPRTMSQRQGTTTLTEGQRGRLNDQDDQPATKNLPGDGPRQQTAPMEPARGEEKRTQRASADLESAKGEKIDGEAEFTEEGDAVKVVVRVEDASPGKKGVHIHERGDCSNIAGQSMGPHFAPTAHQHALPAEKESAARHLGDLGNITVGEDGKGRLEIVVPKASLQSGDQNSFLGKAIVVHAAEDTGSAKQPSGGSGTPIACGVVEVET